MRLKDTDEIMFRLNDFWYSSFGQEQNDFSLAIQECMKIIEDAPSADIIPQPTDDYAKKKRRWENAFQKWSDEHGIENYGNTEDYGCCGFGSMCDWCKDNSYGRPCVRALNAMLREKGKKVDYDDTDFVKVWRGW